MTDTIRLMLIDVQDDGLRVALENGSKWRINPIDSKAVRKWIPTTMLRVERASECSKFPYELVNAPEGIIAHAAEIE